MPPAYNIYCDESCHLEKDREPVMALGAVWCPADKTREIARRLREIKTDFGMPRGFEAKWTKVSPGGLDFYRALLDYFFDDDDLHFRAVIIPDKAQLRHEAFGQDHDTWYYKMLFLLLNAVIDPAARNRVFLDIKDTRSEEKVRKLHDVLCNSRYDFKRQAIERVQQVRSHEVEQIQLADLLTGLVAFANRGAQGSEAKQALVDRARERSGYRVTCTTLLRERKFNLLRWQSSEEPE